MLPAPTVQDVLQHRSSSPTVLCCVVFAPPFTKVGKEGVVPRIGYLNDRSGRHVHFYCAGYGGYWHTNDVPDMVTIGDVRYDDGTVIPWAFSQRQFSSFVDGFEGMTKWRYSGEADLILLSPQVDFADCVTYDIEAMIADKAVRSASQLFEAIIQYARSHSKGASAFDFSDRAGARLFADEAGAAVLECLPKPLQNLWKKGQHYAVRDISK
jgi:hypothetical protein